MGRIIVRSPAIVSPSSQVSGAGGTVLYSATFNGTENPLSVGGTIVQNNTFFTKFQMGSGRAYGKYPNPATTGSYEDSYGIINDGLTWPTNQYVALTIYKNGSAGGYQEVEALLNASDTSNSTQCYECYIHWNGDYFKITRWKGTTLSAPATAAYFDEISSVTGVAAPADGDVLEAYRSGNNITANLKRAGLIIATVTADVSSGGRTPYTGGKPGMGADCGDTGGEGPNSAFGIKSLVARAN